MASEANPSPHMEHECVGAVVLVECALALRLACFLCASAVRRRPTLVTTGGPCGKKPTPFFAARAPVVTKVGRSWASDSLPSTGVDVQSFVGLLKQSLRRFFYPPNGTLARTEFSIQNLLWQSAATYSLALSFGTIAKWRPVVNGQKVAINHIKL